MAVECPLCRIAILPGQSHCPRCGMRLDPITAAERHPGLDLPDERTRPTGADLAAVVRRGAVYGLGLVLVAAFLAIPFGRGSSYQLAFENAIGIIGGLTLVVAFLMGGIRLGAVRRRLDLEARMRPETAAAPATRIVVGVAGAVPLGLALLLAVLLH
ncbi:MAG: hypothetical protein NVSMB29_06580 [Candidatus Dormibacteria bacterium]